MQPQLSVFRDAVPEDASPDFEPTACSNESVLLNVREAFCLGVTNPCGFGSMCTVPASGEDGHPLILAAGSSTVWLFYRPQHTASSPHAAQDTLESDGDAHPPLIGVELREVDAVLAGKYQKGHHISAIGVMDMTELLARIEPDQHRDRDHDSVYWLMVAGVASARGDDARRPGLHVFELTRRDYHGQADWNVMFKSDLSEKLGNAFPVALQCFPFSPGAGGSPHPFARGSRDGEGSTTAGLLVTSSCGRVHAFRVTHRDTGEHYDGYDWDMLRYPSTWFWNPADTPLHHYSLSAALEEEKDLSQLPLLQHLSDAQGVVMCTDSWSEVVDGSRRVRLWAAGCHNGNVTLWIRDETDGCRDWNSTSSDPPSGSVLVNGPVAAVRFFCVARGGQEARMKRVAEALRHMLPQKGAAEAASLIPPVHDGICDRPALVVAETMGRVLVFWDVTRRGLSCAESLPEPPRDAPVDVGRPYPDVHADDQELGCPSVYHSLRSVGSAISLPAIPLGSPAPSVATMPRPHSTVSLTRFSEGGKQGRPVTLPCASASAAEGRTSAPPSSQSPSVVTESSPQPRPLLAPGVAPVPAGLLASGVLSISSSDLTGDGQAELLVGTYSQVLIVYSLRPCPGKDPPLRFEPILVRPFTGAVRSIACSPPATDPPTVWVLTTHHLHVLSVQSDQTEERIAQERWRLLERLFAAEKEAAARRRHEVVSAEAAVRSSIASEATAVRQRLHSEMTSAGETASLAAATALVSCAVAVALGS
eukprot:TRINITY_DN9993_c0_g1_i1.p1 TRINITY_DN9993_c0_g1~~TRINITY_DN9993_c0_g1_i1.p1  ORF type:complete len:760 (+),score=189.47 TRINITY_DN9993_c0_g1_i1:66-2345(+)